MTCSSYYDIDGGQKNLPTLVIVKKREKSIWQRRFWEHSIRNLEDWHRLIDYIHFNPIKQGYVDNPIDWQYCSFQ